MRQTDLRNTAEKNGIGHFMDILDVMEEFSMFEFGLDDIVRSGLVRSYLISKSKVKPDL